MTEDFKKTATDSGSTQRQQVGAAIIALKTTVRTTTNATEKQNALLLLERLGETI